ncbi:MAG: tRNA-dihydrouridine synthase A [Myxococcota bacterium]|jgi:tRNA-dihydrouridine synthase A
MQSTPATINRAALHPVSVAPMMERTDRHYRVFMRGITKHTLLYTEMVVAQAVRHGPKDRLLGFDDVEHPISLQLGGDDPVLLAEASKIAEDLGYDEVNLNVGCPSSRVQSGNFGVCLMGDPDRVADCIDAMRTAVQIPVTCKHRIGFDEIDRYEDMHRFVERVAQTGCDRFTVHARKAWLKGLSPKDNRNIPPLRYDDVYRLKQEFPNLVVEINGGLRVADIQTQLTQVDAVMLGRIAWDDPYSFVTVDADIYGDDSPTLSREEVVYRYLPYAQERMTKGHRISHVVKPMLGLYAGEVGARLWRRCLTDGGNKRTESLGEIVETALKAVAEAQARFAESAAARASTATSADV